MAGGLQEGGIYTVSTRRRTNGLIRCLPTLVFREDRVVQLVKRSKLFLIDEIELVNEQEEVSVTRVEVRLNSKGTDLIEVVAIQVGVDAEEPSEDRPDGIPETLWERGADLVGEVFFVIEEALGPVHQRVNVFRRRQFRGPFVLYPVLPEILISWTGRHDWTLLGSTELGNCAVKHVQVVEEIDGVHGQPLVCIFTIGQLNGQSQVTRAESSLSVLS